MDENEAIEELRTIRDLIRWGASRFAEAGIAFGHGTDNALDEAAALARHALSLSHDGLMDYRDAALTENERADLAALFRRRVQERIPAAYLTHEAWFAGLPFYVDERVLVPRSPIAEVIETRFEPWLAAGGVERVLDLCTGSGCIAVACAHLFPDAHVDAADVSEDALEVARINVGQHQVAERVELVRSDLFEGLAGRRYDVIVSNPPYVSAAQMGELPNEYRHEPVVGLEAGASGIEVVERILAQAPGFLNPEGILVVEVGANADVLAARRPDLPFLWLEFSRGGEGVFLLTAEQLGVG